VRCAALAVALVLSAGVASAAICPGPSSFTDVAPTDIFCTDAQWLANRGVTTGCAPDLYCPTDNVTRAQMALFMQRLGTALSPVSLRTSAVNQLVNPISSATQPPSSADVWCATEPVEVASYPRLVVVSGFVSMATGAGGARMQVYTATSTNNGATWARFGSLAFNQQDMEAFIAHSFPVAAHIPMAAGTTLRVAVFPRKHAGVATSIGLGECELNLLVFSQTGATPPYDSSPGERRP